MPGVIAISGATSKKESKIASGTTTAISNGIKKKSKTTLNKIISGNKNLIKNLTGKLNSKAGMLILGMVIMLIIQIIIIASIK